jgi:hypothetical protein
LIKCVCLYSHFYSRTDPDRDKWTPFLLTKVEPYNHNTSIYTFSFGDDSKTRGGEQGDVASALLVRSAEGEGEVKDEKGKPVIRYVRLTGDCPFTDGISSPYTAISPPTEKGSLRLMIKEYKASRVLQQSWLLNLVWWY